MQKIAKVSLLPVDILALSGKLFITGKGLMPLEVKMIPKTLSRHKSIS